MEPKKEDKLPKRFSEVLLEGGSKGESISADEFANELVEYYKLRGWNQGVPTKDTLIRLGLI
jgi:aldehyde:ferredoxin oxidoreductase